MNVNKTTKKFFNVFVDIFWRKVVKNYLIIIIFTWRANGVDPEEHLMSDNISASAGTLWDKRTAELYTHLLVTFAVDL